MKLLTGALLIASLNSGCAVAPHTTPPDLMTLQKSTVALSSDDARCSGWVLKDTQTIITAAHCAGKKVTADFGDGVDHELIEYKKGDESWKTGPDLMIYKSTDTTIVWPKGLPICPFTPYYGQAIVLMGSPLGADWSMSWGRVAKPSERVQNRSFVQVDAKVLPGNSGGPAIDLDYGCVVGVAEFIQVAAPQAGVPYGLNYLTPADQLSEL